MDVVKADYVVDDHVCGYRYAAQRAEVVSVLTRPDTNAFNNVLQSCKTKNRM